MIEEQKRDQSRIAHQKKQERVNIRKGNPTIDEVPEGNPKLWDIPGRGMYWVLRSGSKLYYNQWSASL